MVSLRVIWNRALPSTALAWIGDNHPLALAHLTARQCRQQPARTTDFTCAATLRAWKRRFPSRHSTAQTLRTPAHIGHVETGFTALDDIPEE